MNELLSQNLINRQSALQSRSRGGNTNSTLPCPHSKAFCSSVDSKHLAPSTVLGLCCSRGPLTVAWFVVAIAVFSIKSIFRPRLWSHVRIEICERLKPLFANRNSPSAIVLKAFAITVCATSFHGTPGTIFGAIPHAMSCIGEYRLCEAKASTGLGDAVPQLPASNDDGRAATAKPCVTFTFPNSIAFAVRTSTLNDTKETKRLTGHVGHLRHKDCLLIEGDFIESAGVSAPVPARFILTETGVFLE